MEFQNFRHCERSEAISRNSKFILKEFQNLFQGILDFCSLLGQINLAQLANFIRAATPKTPLKFRIPLFYLRCLLCIRWLGVRGYFYWGILVWGILFGEFSFGIQFMEFKFRNLEFILGILVLEFYFWNSKLGILVWGIQNQGILFGNLVLGILKFLGKYPLTPKKLMRSNHRMRSKKNTTWLEIQKILDLANFKYENLLLRK